MKMVIKGNCLEENLPDWEYINGRMDVGIGEDGGMAI